MKENICQYEQSVLKGQAPGAAAALQNTELAAHVEGCADCSEALKVAGWLRGFASATDPANIPKSGFIWWKAQLIERQKKAARAVQPIIWMQAAAALMVAAGVAWMSIKNPTSLAPTWKTLSGSLALVGAPLAIVLICAAVVYAGFGAYRGRGSGQKRR